MKKIGIIGAMEAEVNILKSTMQVSRTLNKASMLFLEGILCGKEVVVVRSGIGKVNAAVCTQILIQEFEVNAVINTGIAGSLNPDINIGDIVLSSDSLHHDMDVTGFGHPFGKIPQMDCSIFKGDETLIALAKKVCADVNTDISSFVGRVVSGDQFISDRTKKHWLRDTFQADCTEMEGAAIAQTCYLNEVPVLIIRAISDKSDDSAEMDYDVFEAQAIEHSVKLVQGILKEL